VLSADASIVIRQPVERAFTFVATGFFENYPRWERKVIALEQTSPGPIRVGTTGRQVRKAAGRTTAANFKITEYEPNQKFAFEQTSKPLSKSLFLFEPVPEGTRLTFTFELHLTGFSRWIERLYSETVRIGAEETVHNVKYLVENAA
jgi:hypothetical protein